MVDTRKQCHFETPNGNRRSLTDVQDDSVFGIAKVVRYAETPGLFEC